LVDIFAHRGFQVRHVSVAEADEVFSLRLAIEPDAVANGARLASDADHERARAALLELNAALLAGDLRQSAHLNSVFHLSLLVPQQQPATTDVLHRLHSIAQRYVRMHLKPRGRSRRAIREHRDLLDAWSERRIRAVRDTTRTHIEETRAELIDALANAVGMVR
jgi:DNA-binding GntR family transcriptional regulator